MNSVKREIFIKNRIQRVSYNFGFYFVLLFWYNFQLDVWIAKISRLNHEHLCAFITWNFPPGLLMGD